MNDNSERHTYGEDSRFLVVRFVGRDGGVVFVVHDASWVTDDEVRAGKRSPTVGIFDTIEEAHQWCDFVEARKITSVPHEANFEGWPELKERVNDILFRH